MWGVAYPGGHDFIRWLWMLLAFAHIAVGVTAVFSFGRKDKGSCEPLLWLIELFRNRLFLSLRSCLISDSGCHWRPTTPHTAKLN